MGFTVAPLMCHPFGTGNRLVMFQRDFIELMGIVRPEALAGSGLRRKSMLDDGHHGALDICFLSTAMAEDHARLEAQGLAEGQPYHVLRPVTLPDGRETAAEFDVVWATAPAPHVGALFCQQHVPEALWVPDWQAHANGATGIASLAVIADDPARLAERLAAIAGARPVPLSAGEHHVPLDGCVLHLLRPDRFADRYAIPTPEGPASGFIAGVDIRVEDLDRARDALQRGGVTALATPAGLLVPADEAAGTCLRFRIDDAA